MRQSRRHPQHAIVLAREANRFPAAEGGRIAAQIYRDIQNLSGYHAHQFSLRALYLVMQPTHHIVRGERVIVLDEMLVDAHFGHGALVVAFQEIAALIAKDSRLKNQYSVQ